MYGLLPSYSVTMLKEIYIDIYVPGLHKMNTDDPDLSSQATRRLSFVILSKHV